MVGSDATFSQLQSGSSFAPSISHLSMATPMEPNSIHWSLCNVSRTSYEDSPS